MPYIPGNVKDRASQVYTAETVGGFFSAMARFFHMADELAPIHWLAHSQWVSRVDLARSSILAQLLF